MTGSEEKLLLVDSLHHLGEVGAPHVVIFRLLGVLGVFMFTIDAVVIFIILVFFFLAPTPNVQDVLCTVDLPDA